MVNFQITEKKNIGGQVKILKEYYHGNRKLFSFFFSYIVFKNIIEVIIELNSLFYSCL